MLLFDSIDVRLKPVVAYLQQASRKERSLSLYDKCIAALGEARAKGDDAAFILIAQAFGLIIDQHGYADESIGWLSQAVECARRCEEFGEQAHLLHLIGRAYYSRAEYRTALNYWVDGMDVAERGGDHISWSWCQLGVGQVCDALDAPALAVRIFEELAQSLSTIDNLARVLPPAQRARFAMRLRELRVINGVNLGVNQMHLQSFESAIINFELARSMACAEGMDDISGECQVRVAEVLALRGEPVRALELLQTTQPVLEACSHHWCLATLHLLRAQCLSSLGQLTQATAAIALARDAAGRANVKHIALRIEQHAATLYEQVGDLPQALHAMKRVVALQSDLERYANLQMLRELKELSKKNTFGSQTVV